MRTHLLIFIALILFSFAPAALAGTVPVGGSCSSVNDCVSGLACVSGVCQNIGTGGSPGIGLINPLQSGSSLPSFLGSILNFVIRIGSVVVILMMVFVGFKFVTAQGNETKISEAKGMLLWTVIGALILLGAKAIAIGICETTNALSNSGSVVSCIF